jgi:hypothetical protein
LNGGTTLTMQWPTLPDEFTICSLTRYTSSSTTNQQRILTNTGTRCEWLHGHHNNKRGVAFYNGWRTFEMSFGSSTDWLVMCGQNSQSNSDAIPRNIIADGCWLYSYYYLYFICKYISYKYYIHISRYS